MVAVLLARAPEVRRKSLPRTRCWNDGRGREQPAFVGVESTSSEKHIATAQVGLGLGLGLGLGAEARVGTQVRKADRRLSWLSWGRGTNVLLHSLETTTTLSPRASFWNASLVSNWNWNWNCTQTDGSERRGMHSPAERLRTAPYRTWIEAAVSTSTRIPSHLHLANTNALMEPVTPRTRRHQLVAALAV